MRIETSDLTGTPLDWAVAMALGRAGTDVFIDDFDELGAGCVQTQIDPFMNNSRCWAPSRYWQQAGPIIEREKITLMARENNWSAFCIGNESIVCAPTALVAAMRLFVMLHFGFDVDIPDEART